MNNIRILCFNIHKGVGWGKHKSTLHQLKDSIQTLDPDIIFLQEIRGSQFDLLQHEMWPYHSYGKNVVYETEHHGNAIFSKFPIHATNNLDLSMHRYERRGLLHSIATLDNKNLHLLCVHLGLLAKYRCRQFEKIEQYIKDNIPDNEKVIFAGDFNDWASYGTGSLIKRMAFEEAFLKLHRSYARSYPAWVPILKLDRVYFKGFKAAEATRLVKKPWRYLSDHIALDVILSQHEENV